MTWKFRWPLVMAVTILSASACSTMSTVNPFATRIRLYNNSGRTILVDDHEIAARDDAAALYPAGSNQRVFIFTSGCVLSYGNLPEPPSKYSGWGFFGSSARAQLESDGRIFLVRRGTRFPANLTAVEQPIGFPLIPLRGSGCEPAAPPTAAVPDVPAAAQPPVTAAPVTSQP